MERRKKDHVHEYDGNISKRVQICTSPSGFRYQGQSHNHSGRVLMYSYFAEGW